ncbi:type VI secretion system tip protein TssI/VgrG [Geobacter sp.]|uniref:type VI secretion system tip protein TssI/VgrG n=1 Tax=Geobacter sp. TaxID=46610 RepID=UPI0026023EEE|nr:type VI secretion system tip protein TssI/VgrG [Geobacter sp.]
MHNRIRTKFKINIIDTTYKTDVEYFKAKEQISEAFVITVDLVSKDKIHFNDVIKNDALLTIVGNDEDRYFHGMISNFMLTGKNGTFYTYQAILVPAVWMLSFNKNFRIFQDLSVVEIATKILEENQILSDSYAFRLKSDYPKRRYCTQYGESDFHFICRILEEEGIFFFFEHTEDSHTIVFSDTEIAYTPIEGEDEISFNYDSGMVAERETIQSFAYNRAICPGKITHTNYNFKRPSLDMTVTEEGDTHQVHELYEFPGNYGLPPEGSTRARVHLEEAKSLQESAQGTSNCARFIPGRTFTISEHTHDDLNREYCLISVEHEGSQPNVYGEYSGIGGDYTYSNHFIAIPATTVYRTRNTLKKPYVRGIQSAMVTGPEGEDIHTDEYGRIKVQFHWDREGGENGKSSCWLRTSQPWSGNGWGLVSLPRVGDEVLVDFLNGDPDRPIVVGSVNNAASPALYPLPANKTQSGIRTRSTPGGGRDNFNELRFEDKKGAEEVYLQAEKDFNAKIKNNESKTVGNNLENHIGKTAIISAGEQLRLVCGNASILLDNSGRIVINGTEVSVSSTGTVSIAGAPVKLN